MVPEPAAAGELREYLHILRRQAKVIAMTVAVVFGSALAVSLVQTPVYRASAQVILQETTSDSLFNPSTGQRNDPTRAVATEIQVLKSPSIREAVRAELGDAPPVGATPVGQTDVIQVAVSNTDPKAAAALANAYARHYIDQRRTGVVEGMLSAGQQVQAKIDDLQKQIDALGAQINAASPVDRPGVVSSVGPQRDALVTQQSTFKNRLDQLGVEAALSTGGAQLVTPASVPTSPVAPKPVRNGALALVVGTLFGVGLAFLFDRLDDSLKSAHDLERVAGSLPTLGIIPAVSGAKGKEEAYAVTRTEPQSTTSEAYRSLRTSIRLLRLDQPLAVIQVTSPALGEGKSTTVANLAVTMAQVGLRTAIVCCDLRRPRIHEFFGLSNAIGFTSVLLGDELLSNAMQVVPGQENLYLLASGPTPANPSELLSGARVGEMLDALRTIYDLVLVDCPPVLPVTDAAVLSTRVDGTLLVAFAGSTNGKSLRRSIEILHQVGAPLVGVVLNGAGGDAAYGYGYGYGGYGPAYAPHAPKPMEVANGGRRKSQSVSYSAPEDGGAGRRGGNGAAGRRMDGQAGAPKISNRRRKLRGGQASTRKADAGGGGERPSSDRASGADVGAK